MTGKGFQWKRHVCLYGIAAIMAMLVGPTSQATTPVEAKAATVPRVAPLGSEAEKRSYAIGMTVAAQLNSTGLAVDIESLVRGIKDATSGGKTLMSESEVVAVVGEMQREEKAKLTAQLEEKRQRNQQEGESFLAANKTREGVVTLPSGLQYKILKAGDGKKPALDDTIVCNYRGTLLDGTEFDSSYKRKQAATFPVKKVVKGWTEALQLMPVGSKWQLFIPSSLAYGQAGAGRAIGPNATLTFEVELLAIMDPNVAVTARGTTVSALSEIKVSFKLDPRISGPTYGGEHWVAPATFTSEPQAGQETTVEARVEGIDARHQPTTISPTWAAEDPDMVTVLPVDGNQAKITVKRAGRTRVSVAAQGVTKSLTIDAVPGPSANGLKIAITQ